MKTIVMTLAAAAFAAAVASPAAATTFPTLTTIYVVAGATDSGEAANVGKATTFMCSNVSGVLASIRFRVFNQAAILVGSLEGTIVHTGTISASTHNTALTADALLSPGIPISGGAVVVESTQSAVFCSAMIVDASSTLPSGIALHAVRINGHPGAEE